MLKYNNSGISLIEAMLAITILTVGILTAVNLFPLALKNSENAEAETVASNLAQAKMESLAFDGYSNIGVGEVEARHRLSSDPQNPFYQYEREAIVELLNGNLESSASDLGLKKITINMYWTNTSTGLEQTLTINSLISEK